MECDVRNRKLHVDGDDGVTGVRTVGDGDKYLSPCSSLVRKL